MGTSVYALRVLRVCDVTSGSRHLPVRLASDTVLPAPVLARAWRHIVRLISDVSENNCNTRPLYPDTVPLTTELHVTMLRISVFHNLGLSVSVCIGGGAVYPLN